MATGPSVSTVEFNALKASLNGVVGELARVTREYNTLNTSFDDSVDKIQALEAGQVNLKKQTELTTTGASSAAHQIGLIEKAERALGATFWGSRLGAVTNLGIQLGNLSDVVNVYSNNEKDTIEATNKLTKAQKYLLKPLLSTTLGAKAGVAMWEQFRDMTVDAHGNTKIFHYAILKLSSFLLTLISIFGIVGFAIGVFSLAASGQGSFLVEWTEGIPLLGEAMKGLAALLSGGDADFIQYVKGGLLLIVGALFLLPAALAPFIVAIIIGIVIFKKFKKSGMDTGEAIKWALTSALIAFAAVMQSGLVIKAFWWLAKKVLMGLSSALVIGAALLLVGLTLMRKGALGEIEGWMGDAAIVFGAGVVLIGLHVLAGVAGVGTAILGIPFFWVIAIIAIVALLIRHNDWLRGHFIALWEFLRKGWNDLVDDIPLIGGSLVIAKGDYETKAMGGSVRSGRSYLVGERGPELFSPSASGNITPNHNLGGGTTNNISLSIDVGGVTDHTDKRALAREISDALNQELRRLGGQPTRGRY